MHKNSLDYIGSSHVYVIRDREGNLYKIGETAQRVNQNGESIRAKAQTEKILQETGEVYTSGILNHFDNKRDAVNYQDQLRDRYRSLFGNELLPGNREHLRGKKQNE